MSAPAVADKRGSKNKAGIRWFLQNSQQPPADEHQHHQQHQQNQQHHEGTKPHTVSQHFHSSATVAVLPDGTDAKQLHRQQPERSPQGEPETRLDEGCASIPFSNQSHSAGVSIPTAHFSAPASGVVSTGCGVSAFGTHGPPRCQHGEPAVARKVGENHGREFYACRRPVGPPPHGRCDFFLWAVTRARESKIGRLRGGADGSGGPSVFSSQGSRAEKRPRQI